MPFMYFLFSASYEAAESEGSPASFTDDKVGIYIAKYTYVPSEMSPNENYDLELLLTAGDYLYVYGEMDSDGYYHGQLLTGESGMVPSNFIDRVMDEEGEERAKERKNCGILFKVVIPLGWNGGSIVQNEGKSLWKPNFNTVCLLFGI